MSNHNILDVNAGETYTIDGGDTEEWFRATIDGTLHVTGTLRLIDDPDLPTEPVQESPTLTSLQNPDSLTTPLTLFIITIVGAVGYLGAAFRNPLIIFLWFLTVAVFVLTILLPLSFIWFWLIVIVDMVGIITAGVVSGLRR